MPLLLFSRKTLKIASRGPSEVPKISIWLESSYFCDLGAYAKIRSPSCHLSSRKLRASERKKRDEEKFLRMPMGVLAPWSPHARPSAQPPIHWGFSEISKISGGQRVSPIFWEGLLSPFLAKGCSKKNLTNYVLFSSYLAFLASDLQNFCVYPP